MNQARDLLEDPQQGVYSTSLSRRLNHSHIQTHLAEDQHMAFGKETAAKVESLYQEHLEEAFQERYAIQ